MVTLKWLYGREVGGTIELVGLSTDAKPIKKYNGTTIRNGSSFFEIDTGELYFYDAENNEWIKYEVV